jgi:hypothetical protein
MVIMARTSEASDDISIGDYWLGVTRQDRSLNRRAGWCASAYMSDVQRGLKDILPSHMVLAAGANTRLRDCDHDCDQSRSVVGLIRPNGNQQTIQKQARNL